MSTVTVDGVRIGYTDTGGDGTPVLLIHGWPLNATLWDPQVEALADRARLIVPDLRGFGSSDAPEDVSAYSMATFARDLIAVLDDAGVNDVVACGISMGGYVCFELWRSHRTRIAGFVLVDTRAEADPPEGIERRTAQQRQVEAEGTAGLIRALTAGPLLSDATRDKKPDVVARVEEIMDNPVAGFVGGLEAMKKRSDSSADLTGITVPTLIVVGEDDALIPVAMSRTMHEHIGGSRLVVIPEAGHLSSIEAPQAFNGAVAGFLSELGTSNLP